MRTIIHHYPGYEKKVLKRRFSWCTPRVDSTSPWNNDSFKIFLLSKCGLANKLCSNFNSFNEVGRSQRVQQSLHIGFSSLEL